MAQKHKGKTLSKNQKYIYIIVVFIIALFVILQDRGVIDTKKIKQALGQADTQAVDASMSVHFIDVGQGDSTLIISDGEAMLIDAGEKECGTVVADYLDSVGVTTLKYVIGTHPHSDHIGGLAYIIENFNVENVIMPKVSAEMTPTTKVYEDLLSAIKSKGLKIHTAVDETITLGETEVEIFAPTKDYTNLNNYSICTKITHGENTFLLTGDTEDDAEEDLIERVGDKLNAKVLKLGHHGSSTASSVELLQAVNPRYAVISCGAGNKYGHPHDEVLNRVKKFSDYILRTDIEGTIIFKSDKEGLSVTNVKGDDLLE